MGRQLEFDRDKALTRATELFWKRGYVNTSVAQLQKAMKLGEGSLYNTFKSKKQLYLECLRHYNATFMTHRSQALRGECAQALRGERGARERIIDFFDVVIEELASNKATGCLVSNSLTNEVLSERELKSYLFGSFDSMLAFLASIVADGQERGELHEDLDPQATARVLFTYLHGLNRLSVYDLDPKARHAETRAFIDGVLRSA